MKTIWMLAAGGVCMLGQTLTPEAMKDLQTAKAGTFQFLTGGLVSGQIVKGAPYSAEAVTETTQTLSDGNRIIQRTSSKQYRDSEGRERQEETASMGAIFISDPVLRASYTLHPESRTAEKTSLVGSAIFQKAYNGENKTFFFSNFEQFRNGVPLLPMPANVTIAPGRTTRIQVVTDSAASVQEEQLGTVQMEGVLAQGTRTTTTIPAGQIGNDRPINVTYERWYSPDLQMTVMTKHNDPRSGETVYKLTNVLRVDQLRSLFEIPSDYSVSVGGTINIDGGNIRLRIPQ